MEKQTAIHATFVIERHYASPPERVFAALSDPAKKQRWYADGSAGHDCESFAMDFRVGGTQRTCYRFKEASPFPGVAFRNDAWFLEIRANRRVVTADTMTMGEHPFSASLVTIELLPAAGGTDVILTHQGTFFENSDGPERREQGWNLLLDRMAKELAS